MEFAVAWSPAVEQEKRIYKEGKIRNEGNVERAVFVESPPINVKVLRKINGHRIHCGCGRPAAQEMRTSRQARRESHLACAPISRQS